MFEFWQSLGFITAAEMADKTQLVTLAFATRFSPWTTLAGVLVATLAINLFSVTIGQVVGMALPTTVVTLAAGLAFIGFGVWTLRSNGPDEEASARPGRFGPFLTVAVTFFLAEMGDKTMLATVTLASQTTAFISVWLGASLGMMVAEGIAIIGGVVAGHRLPERAIKYGAAAIFIVAGLVMIGEAAFSAL